MLSASAGAGRAPLCAGRYRLVAAAAAAPREPKVEAAVEGDSLESILCAPVTIDQILVEFHSRFFKDGKKIIIY